MKRGGKYGEKINQITVMKDNMWILLLLLLLLEEMRQNQIRSVGFGKLKWKRIKRRVTLRKNYYKIKLRRKSGIPKLDSLYCEVIKVKNIRIYENIWKAIDI